MPRARRPRAARSLLLAGALLGVLAAAPGGAASAQEVPPPVPAPPAPDQAVVPVPVPVPAPVPVVPVVPVAPSDTPTVAPPVPTGFLRLGLSARVVRGAGSLVVSGRLYRATNAPAAGVLLDVLGRLPGRSAFVPLGRVTTDDAGLARLPLVARVSREYQLRTVGAPALTSGTALAEVQPVLTGALGPTAVQVRGTSVLSGRLAPAYAGARVRVQRRLPAGWTTVATVGTAADGSYRWSTTPGVTGRLVLRAALPAAAAHRAAATPALALAVGDRVLHPGDRGADVLLLQQRLAAVKADVGPLSGVFGYDLVHAVLAFQKAQGLPRTGVDDAATRARLARPAAVRLRYPADGRSVEVDVSKQVLYVSEGGRLTRIVDVSTGSDQLYESDGVTYRAFTPLGRFRVQRKIDGIDVGRLGVLYRPAYFTQGWAVHGSASVPVYPASHGCVRVTDPAMDRLYGLLTIGVPVGVYRS